ncbi:hypothetical protein VTO42DRAFT_2461 [Malbranchea cinnamomea]
MPIPAYLVAWAGSSAWMYFQNVIFQFHHLSSEYNRLPAEMQWIQRKTELLSLCLRSLNRVCRLHGFLNETDKGEVLRLCESISNSIDDLARLLKSASEQRKAAPPAFVKQLLHAMQVWSPPKWEKDKSAAAANLEDIRAEIDILSKIVAANHAMKTTQDLAALRDEIKHSNSMLKRLFRPSTPRKKPVEGQDAQLTASFSREAAKEHVKALCERNETFRWHGFLEDRSRKAPKGPSNKPSRLAAIILVGEAKNLENILGFFIWRADDGLVEIFKVDRTRPFQTFPWGATPKKVTVMASEKGEIPVTLRTAEDAKQMRGLLEHCTVRFVGSLQKACNYEDWEGNRRKTLKGLRDGHHVAEVLDLENNQRVLQLWPCREDGGGFKAGEDGVYLHHRLGTVSYQVIGQDLMLHDMKMIRTTKGIAYLRGQRGEEDKELEGSFKLTFASEKDAKEVYSLLMES